MIVPIDGAAGAAKFGDYEDAWHGQALLRHVHKHYGVMRSAEEGGTVKSQLGGMC